MLNAFFALTALLAPQAAPTPQAPVPYRILVTGVADDAPAQGLAEDAARAVRAALQASGETVLRQDLVDGAASRAEKLGGHGDAVPALTDADLTIHVNVAVELSKMQQGRFVVRDTVRVSIAGIGTTAEEAAPQARGDGNSIESQTEAHRQALGQALGDVKDPKSTLGWIVGALAHRREDEARRGVAYTFAIHSELPDGIDPILVADDLRGLPGVDADSFQLDNASATQSTYRMRLRRSNAELRDQIYALVAAKRRAVREATQRNLTADVWISRGSCDVVLRLTPPDKVSVDRVLESTMLRIVEPMYRRGPQWYDNSKPRFQPAFLPEGTKAWNDLVGFANSYWGAYNQTVKAHPDATDPLDVEGSVEVGGRPFKSLRTAKEEAERLATGYYASPVGEKAQQIARFAEEAFRKVSEGRVNGQVDDMVQSSVLYTIKSDADLFRDEGAVDQSSIQWFTRQGTDRLVVTRLSRPLDSFRLEVIVVDVANGLKQTGSAELDPVYSEDLNGVLGG